MTFISRLTAIFALLSVGLPALAVGSLPLLPLFAPTAVAAPACQLQVTSQLNEYHFDNGANGLLSVLVHCPDTGRYVLRIESEGAPLNGPDVTLRLADLAGGAGQADVSLIGLSPTTPFSGTQRFDFELLATPGQWQLVGGTYRLVLTVRADSLDAGAPE